MNWNRFFRTFRLRLFLSYASIVLLFLVWLLISSRIWNKIDRLQDYNMKVIQTLALFQENYSALNEALLSATKSEDFYDPDGPRPLRHFILKERELRKELLAIQRTGTQLGLDVDGAVDSLVSLQDRFESDLERLERLLMKRGFRDMGLIGEMRKSAHALETDPNLRQAEVLQLRRHEKDFLLRNDMIYPRMYDALAQKLAADLGSSEKKEAEHTLAILRDYRHKFGELVNIELTLGFSGDKGVIPALRRNESGIRDYLGQLRSLTDRQVDSRTRRFNSVLMALLVAEILILLSMGLIFSRGLTRDLNALGIRIKEFVQSGFVKEQKPFRPRIVEVASINSNFNKLKIELKKVLNRLEEEKQKAQQNSFYKTRFLANMSHEIRTPLNGIVGMLHHLKSTALDEDQQDYVETIDFSAGHLLNLVNLILDFSKIEAGKMELELVEFDLAGDLKKIMAMLRSKAEEKGLDFHLNIDGEGEHMLMGDPLRLQQVMINLLNNALKFTDRGSVELRVKALLLTDRSERVTFEVRDTGVGISDEQKERLFSAFEQSDNSTTRRYGGTGLGLTISSQIIEMMGGKLEVESKPEAGSCFYFTLDFKVASGKLKHPLPESGDPPPEHLRILMAEDNPVNQKVLQLMLERNECEVSLASNGKEAVDHFLESDFDLILMDIQMPVMDGTEATQFIKATQKYRQRPVPIVAVTANAFESDRKLFMEKGLDDVLSKPVKASELKGLLAKYTTGGVLRYLAR